MQLKILNQFNIVKQGDTKSEFKFQLLDFAEQPINLSGKTAKVIIANNIGKVLEKSPTVLDTTTGTISFAFGKNDVTGSGDMRLEIHVTDGAGDTQIIPSNGYYKFAIERNLNDASTGVTNYTLKYFTDQFNAKMTTFDNKMAETNGAIQTANQSAQTANTAANNADAKVAELEDRVDQAIAAGTVDLEVKNARGTHTNLRQRLDSTDAQLAERPTQEEVNALLGDISDGTPLFAEDISGMTDITRLYVNTTDGLIYVHNGTTFVSTGRQYQSTGIAEGSIGANETNFLKIKVTSKNLFNPNDKDLVLGKVLTSTGSFVGNGIYNTTGYMPLAGRVGNVWASWESGSSSIIRAIAFYDENKNWLSGSGDIVNNGFSIPQGAKYLRVSYPASAVKYQIEVGIGETSYEPYTEISYFDKSKLELDISVTPEMVTFLKTKPIKNLFNPNDPNHQLGVYLNTSGVLMGNGFYNTSGYMDITDDGDIYISRTGGTGVQLRAYAFYDANKTFISGWSDTTDANHIIKPVGAVYLRVSYHNASEGYQVEVGQGQTTYEPYAEMYFIDESVVKIEKGDDSLLSPWKGKKLVTNGDSITYGTGGDTGDYTGMVAYPVLVAQNLGMSLNNYAIGGSTIAVRESTPTEKNPIVTRYTNMTNEADLVLIAGGTNDWANSWTPVGTMADRTNYTFYGALHNLCLGLLEKYLGKQLLFMTPIKRYNPTTKNDLGYTLKQYGDIIKEVCGYYGIPVLDMYHEAIINPNEPNQNTALIPDGTHPNKLGQEVMARRVTGYLRQLA